MIDREMVQRDLGPVEERLAGPAGDGWWVSLLLADQARAQEEDAAIEAEDVLSQADEALVLG